MIFCAFSSFAFFDSNSHQPTSGNGFSVAALNKPNFTYFGDGYYDSPGSVPDRISYLLGEREQNKRRTFLAMKSCRGFEEIDTKEKVVALTFDDGPHKKSTHEILEILRDNNIKATFFVIGEEAARYPALIKEEYADGNVIGNHSYTHPNILNFSADEIENELSKTNQKIFKIIKVYPTLFRPPYGICSNELKEVLDKMQLKEILWSDMVDDYDFTKTSPEKIAAGILQKVKPGAIIGLHDGGGNREKTVGALKIIITELQAQGYQFVTVPELSALRKE